MRVAILTLPLHTNYGQILQCYALQTYLQKIGHQVEVLDDALYTREYYLKIPFIYFKRAILKVFFRKKIDIWTLPYQKVRLNTQRFIDLYIHRREVRSWSSTFLKKYDAYIVGSDQVWRPKYFISDRRQAMDLAFLSFVPSDTKIKISYAASFGTDSIEYTIGQKDSCRKCIKDFVAVSVREDSAIALCQDLFDVKAKHVIDPTMLLLQDDYVKLFEAADVEQHKGELLVYLLDEEDYITNFVNDVMLKTGMTLNYLSMDDTKYNTDTFNVKPSVEQWLRGFYDASFIVTDSFHGCVFSILYNKPFAVFVNEKRGASRIKSLLRKFDLLNQMVTGEKKHDYNSLINIDWKRVNLILSRERQIAKDFLEILNR